MAKLLINIFNLISSADSTITEAVIPEAVIPEVEALKENNTHARSSEADEVEPARPNSTRARSSEADEVEAVSQAPDPPQQKTMGDILQDWNGQAESKVKIFTPINEILNTFDKNTGYTKDQALRLIGLTSNYSTRQVHDIYERMVFEGTINIQKADSTPF